MEEVANAAHISRPGLYFLFGSKPALFREAVSHALERDLEIIAHELGDSRRPLNQRLVAALDQWAGPYLGPLATDIGGAAAENPGLLGETLETAPRRFEELITHAIADFDETDAVARAQTIISASIGIKHQTTSREAYSARLTVAVDLILSCRCTPPSHAITSQCSACT